MNIPIDDALEKIQINPETSNNSGKNSDLKEESDDLDILLNKLGSEEAKINALIAAVEHNATDNKNHLVKVMDFYRVKEEFVKAGKVAENLNEYELAFQFYDLTKAFHSSAILAERLGRYEDAIQFCLKLANEKKFYYESAGDLAVKMGNIPRAINFYVDADTSACYLKAGKLTEQTGEYERAMKFYHQSGSFAAKQEIDRMTKSRKYRMWRMNVYEIESNYMGAHRIAKELNDKEKMQLYKSLAKLIYKQELD